MFPVASSVYYCDYKVMFFHLKTQEQERIKTDRYETKRIFLYIFVSLDIKNRRYVYNP